MRKKFFAGLKINSLSWKALFNDKVMYIAYGFFLIALIGVSHVFYERFLMPSATAFDAGLNPGNRDVALAMKEAVFGSGGEVKINSLHPDQPKEDP